MPQMQDPTTEEETKEDVFLFTDASYCPDTGAAGWAMVVIDRNCQRVASASLSQRLSTSADAERLALAHGVAAAIRLGFARPGVTLNVFADHMCLRNALSDAGRDDARGRLAKWLIGRMEDNGFTLEIRHVKAHVQKDAREYHHEVNAIVDRLSRERMRERRGQLTSQPRILRDLADPYAQHAGHDIEAAFPEPAMAGP